MAAEYHSTGVDDDLDCRSAIREPVERDYNRRFIGGSSGGNGQPGGGWRREPGGPSVGRAGKFQAFAKPDGWNSYA